LPWTAADGALRTLRRSAPSPSSSAAAGPRPRGRSGLGTRAHVTALCPRSIAAAPRVPSPARPRNPDPVGALVVHGHQSRPEHRALRARATPGEPDAFLVGDRVVGDRALSRQVGVVGSGRAWGAKRGGNLGDATEPRRVLARQALNGSTASAWPPLRWNGGFQAVQQGQLRAANRR